MRRSFSAAAAVLATFALAVGGLDCGPVLHPTGSVCDGQTEADALECEGEVCLVLNPNAQDMPGMCSALCTVDEECTPHERCVAIDTDSVCLRACNTDDDCYDAFVCRQVIGLSTSFCLADFF